MSLVNYIKRLYREYILVRYDAKRYTYPDRNRKLKPKSAMPTNLATHTIIGTDAWSPDEEVEEGALFSLSKSDEYRLHPGRVKALSKKDIAILTQRNLSIEKAVIIKPYWAQGYSRKEISAALSRKNGVRVSGYSVSTVGSICAAFTAALSQSDYETVS
jgi:hypothetical protein